MEDKEISQERVNSVSPNSPTRLASRRRLLQGAIAGTAGLSLAGVAGVSLANAQSQQPVINLKELSDQPNQSTAAALKQFFSILATGEALAQTFYSNAIAHSQDLRLSKVALNTLEAIRAEEQLHFNLAVSLGGTPVTTHFSFPHGPQTFLDIKLFFQTQQQIEETTSAALLALIKDTASMGQPRLSQLGGQLMQVEGGHRVLGRVLEGVIPFANWGFAPVVIAHFTDVPTVVKAAGFLSPKQGNDFAFQQVDPCFPGLIDTTPGKL